MNILGIDFGTKHIGLAWVQEGLDVVLPFGVIDNGRQTTDDSVTELVDLIQKERIDKGVIGLPLTLEDGSENMNTKRVRAFGEALFTQTGIPIAYVDERLTSFEADEMGGGASRDEKAAMVILQTYLEQSKHPE